MGSRAGSSEDCPGEVATTDILDGRLYIFILPHTRSDARAFVDAFVATIDLRPEEAAGASSSTMS